VLRRSFLLRFALTVIFDRYLFHSFRDSPQQLILLLSSLKCTQYTDEGEERDLGSIFEIESGSKPPSTLCFQTLSAEAIKATTKKSEGRVTSKDLVLTFQRAMGLAFEALDQTPSRPEVDKHPGKITSLREALRSANKTEFQSFNPRPQQFVFSKWPTLAGAKDSVISFACKNSTQHCPVTDSALSSPADQVARVDCGASVAADWSRSLLDRDSFESLRVRYYQKGSQGCNQSASPGVLFAGLSTEFCSGVFGLKTSVSMVLASTEPLPGTFHKTADLERAGRFVYGSSTSHHARLRAACNAAAGLVVQRAVFRIAPAAAYGKTLQQMMIFILMRVASKRVAATFEGATLAETLFFDKLGKREVLNRAFELSTIGANLGCPHNKGVLGCCYAYGRGVAEDRVKGFELARQSAAEGSCIGQFCMGKCYYMAWGVAEDEKEAIRFWRLAAEQGHVGSQNNLGKMFECGYSVPKNYAEAVRLYRLAAAQDDDFAQANLGLMLQLGRGVPHDGVEAIRLYRLAAARGNAQAQLNLGHATIQGLFGVVCDYNEAARLYRLAAAQDEVDAQVCLGDMLMQGLGVAQDSVEAVRLYGLAANAGSHKAQFNLGCAFERGAGVAQDVSQAIRWYLAAAKQGMQEAMHSVMRLDSSTSYVFYRR
jgi:TPR repeat protein